MIIDNLEAALCQRLHATVSQLRQVFEIEQRADDNFVVQLREDWIDRDTWLTVNDYVREQKGEWDSKAKQWTVPYGTDSEASYKEPRNENQAPAEPSSEIVPRFTYLPSDSILSMPFQSRISLEDSEIADLSASLQEHGILEPLLVRRRPTGNYELVFGHRRLKAAAQAGITQVPCIIREMTDQQAMEAHFIENLQRRDLSDYEKARMLDYLLKHFPEEYSTQEVLAYKIGKTQGWVAQRLRMLELAEDKIITRVINPGQLTERQARAILEVPEDKRPEVAGRIAEHIKREGAPPSAREIRRFVHPEVKSSAAPIDVHEESEEPDDQLTIEEPEMPEEPIDSSQVSDSQTHEESTIPKESEESFESRSVTPTIPVEKIDTGFVFECPVCDKTFHLIHVKPSGAHKFEEDKLL